MTVYARYTVEFDDDGAEEQPSEVFDEFCQFQDDLEELCAALAEKLGKDWKYSVFER